MCHSAKSQTSEDDGLLEVNEVCQNAGGVVAKVQKSLAEGGVLHRDPRFLIKKEQVHVVQEWGLGVGLLVVTATHNQKRVVAGKVGHCVTVSLAGWLSLLLELLPLSLHYAVTVHCGL